MTPIQSGRDQVARRGRLARVCSGAITAAVVAAMTVGLQALSPAPAQADTKPVDPADPRTPITVSADGLPTVQINGVVWTQKVIGDTVYVGGNFTSARPAGSATGIGEVARANFLAYKLSTGQLISTFNLPTNGQVRALAASADGSRLYVGGAFTQIGGVARNRIAAINTATGELVSGFKPNINYDVYAIGTAPGKVFVGGDFQGVGTQPRGYLAAFTTAGDLLDWAPQANAAVYSLAVNPSGEKVAVGGQFTTVNGSSNPGKGLAIVDGVSGALLPTAANSVVKSGGGAAAITSLSSDGSAFYGTGYNFGSADGLEGAFSASWNGGTVKWVDDCHGDLHSLYVASEVVYAAGHSHYCGNIDGFPQPSPWDFYRAVAFGKKATGTVWAEPYGYYNYAGQPASSLLGWFPRMNPGTFTGQNQGPWSVDGNADYIVYGGEFTTVNGKAQQGLVRLPRRELAPNLQGPLLYSTTYPIKVTSTEAGTVRVNFSTNRDNDNENLTYRVYRNTVSPGTKIYDSKIAARFWNPMVYGVEDKGLAPGSTPQYRVQVIDPYGNVANSPWTSVTVAATGTASGGVVAARNTFPNNYWRLGSTADSIGSETLIFGTGVTSTAGALANDTDTARKFDGTSAGVAYTTKWQSPPTEFTLSGWFKTTSAKGGKIIGFGNNTTTLSTAHDRNVYLDDTGKLRFGVTPAGTPMAVASTATYRDGNWHHFAATLNTGGLKLYVDGAKVAERTDVSHPKLGYWGQWRIGGDQLNGWPSRPTSNFLNGSLDEIMVNHRALNASEVQALSDGGRGQNMAPAGQIAVTTTDLRADFTTTAADWDGSVASYQWDFGDGSTATGATATRTYAAAGTYEVKLTVTDNAGKAQTLTKSVTVRAANQLPTARFTSTANLLVAQFDASTTTDADGSITDHLWDFGDGTKSTLANPSHTFPSPGTYQVQLTVTDDREGVHTVTQPVTVRGPNVAPTANFVPTMSGSSLSVNASSSADSDGTIASYQWDFGDGSTATGVQATHAYAAVGTYQVKLTVTDNDGATATVTKPVEATPANQPPTASFTKSMVRLTGSFDASAATDSDGTVSEYRWNFGDGTNGTGPQTSHQYASAGTYQVTLTVVDDDGAQAQVTQSVTATAPVIDASDAFGRSITGGWGSADKGGAWVRTGTATNFNVAGGIGTMKLGAAATGLRAVLPVSRREVEMSVKVSASGTVTGSGVYLTAEPRVMTNGDGYYVTTRVLPDKVLLVLGKRVGTVSTALGSYTVPNLTAVSGEWLNVRVRAVDGVAGETVLSARVWKVGDTEPTTWQVTARDTATSLQGAGGVALTSYLGGTATSVPVTARFDDLVWGQTP